MLDRINSNSKKRIVLHIWGKITDEKTMTQINVSQFIQYHGLIENVYTAYLLKTADFCLNLSNAITYNMVPSKIFQLFALSKPIINIVANDNDVSLEYFIKNEYVINIYKKFNTDCNAALLTKWMRDPLLERPVNISRLYGKSRPTYTVELIESYL